MDELTVRCKQQLETFRIKELKDVLSRIGAAKQGKKQVLVDKIMEVVLFPERRLHVPKGLKPETSSKRHVVSREEVAKVIDDIYRKMRGPGATDLATVVGNMPVSSNSLVRLDDQDEALNRGEAKTRCPCGSTIDSGTMIQCDDPSCMVWQHVSCVIIPEKEEMEVELPPQFYCEICRIQHGDPFCVGVAHPLLPTKMTTPNVCSEGLSPLQTVETTFILSHSDRELLHKTDYDLQIWCVLLNDKVPFRMHWPQYADLQVNGVPVRVTNRPGQQLLGINGRDDGPGIANYTREGTNRISLSAKDGRSFCIGVRIIHRLTLEQVLSCIPSEAEGEQFDVALARVRRCIGSSGGGGVGNNDDSDSDLEIVSEWVTVNLRCPVSGSRMKIAGRFRPCVHMGCFDLCTFVELNQRTRKWQCPICLKNYSLRNLIIDPFFTRITRAMKSYGEDVTEVELKPDGCWRPKLEGDAKLWESWRLPDGSISVAKGERSTSCQGALKAVKIEEGLSVERVPLKIGIKRTRDGTWQVNGSRGLPSIDNPGMLPNRAAYGSSSATASNDGDGSVNQEPSELFNETKRDDVEVNSTFVEPLASTCFSGPLGEGPEHQTAEVIVLSDTEEDNTAARNCGGMTSLHALVPAVEQTQRNHRSIAMDNGNGFTHDGLESSLPFSEVRENSTGNLNLFEVNRGDSTTPEHHNFWPSEEHSVPFEFLGSVSDVPRVAPSLMRPTPVPAVPMPTYGVSNQQYRENDLLETRFLDFNRTTQNFVAAEYRDEATQSMRGLTSTDPSLQLLLPPQPARASVEPIIQDPLDGWFSLSLGGGGSIIECPPNVKAAPYELEKLSQEKRRFDSVADSASVLLDMSSHGSRATDREANVPAHRRTSSIAVHRPAHRSRNYFPVDSDSE